MSPRPRREFRGTGIYGSLILAFLLAIAIVVGIVQNLQTVELRYFGWNLHTPLIVVLLVTILATALLAEVVGLLWRRRRRNQLARFEELRDLRGEVSPHAGTSPAAAAPEEVPHLPPAPPPTPGESSAN